MATYRKLAVLMTLVILSIKLWNYNPFTLQFTDSTQAVSSPIPRILRNKSKIKLFSFNAYLRPPPISHCHSDCKEQRAYILSEIIPHFDIVLLQEMYSCLNSRCHNIIYKAKQRGLEYSYCNNYPTIFSRHMIGDALLILSKYPIIKTDSISFNTYASYDSVMEKGCIYAKVMITPTLSVHVFNTHLQSTNSKHDTEVEAIQLKQLQQVSQFITTKTSNDSSPIVCGGDFNIDALSTPSRDKIYKVMAPLTDIFTEETQPTIKLVYNPDGTEDSSICLSCRQCESLVSSPNNRTIAKQRLDYVFWQQKSSKLKILQKKILPLRLNSKKCSFSQLSDHSALLVELGVGVPA